MLHFEKYLLLKPLVILISMTLTHSIKLTKIFDIIEESQAKF